MEQKKESFYGQINCDCGSKSELDKSNFAFQGQGFGEQNLTMQSSMHSVGMKQQEMVKKNENYDSDEKLQQHGKRNDFCAHHQHESIGVAFQQNPHQNPHFAMQNPFSNPHMMHEIHPHQFQMMYGAPFEAPVYGFQNPPHSHAQNPSINPNFHRFYQYHQFHKPIMNPYYHGFPQNQSFTANPFMQHGLEGYSHPHSHHHNPKHMENRFGMAIDTVNRIMAGQAQPDEIFSIFSMDFNHDQFWKGIVAGALIAFLITNKSVKEGLFNLFASETKN